jgi:hypothetical protein
MKSIQLKIVLTLFIFGSLSAFGQAIKEMSPILGLMVDKSPEGEVAFIKQMERCNYVWGKPADKLTDEDKKVILYCNENVDGVENYYDILGPGCSWYCGGGMDTQTASSELASQGQNSYSAENAHDLDYKTAWIEGVSGYGIGEYLVYSFPPENPRITEIIIVNGYVKSDISWRNNSRVKKLKLYFNDVPIAILNLNDSKHEQIFKFAPIGHGNREDFDALIAKSSWTLKFEILEVYKGEKYDDTAISEIYFNGIDVH